VFVSIVSTKIPFKGAGKEYIGDDVEEMVGAVKQAIQQCGVQLKVGMGGAVLVAGTGRIDGCGHICQTYRRQLLPLRASMYPMQSGKGCLASAFHQKQINDIL
jgi:hypothetical protein